MTKDEALKLALEALEEAHYKVEHKQDAAKREQAITAIKEALAQPEQEPVPENFIDALRFDVAMREWVGLTDDEIFEIHKQVDSMQYLTFGHAIEAKLRSKNDRND